jgi:hypothetical protein
VDHETWNALQLYESTEVLKQLAKERIGFGMTSGQAMDIRSCLRQAREYFHSAGVADITVKPLLLFYGISNLSKALTMLYGGKERSRLCNLSPSHGLDHIDTFVTPLDEVACKISNTGTFPNFNEVVAKNETLTHADIRVQVINASSASLVDIELSLRDLLVSVPELRVLYPLTYGSFNTILQAELSKRSDGYRLGLYSSMGRTLWLPAPEREETEALVGEFLQVEGSQAFYHPYHTEIHLPALPNSESHWVEVAKTESGFRGLLVSQQHEGQLLAPLSVQFLGLYILGMIVRYRPDLWIELTQLGHNDRPLAITKAFIDHCEASFPQGVLALLANS